MSLNLYNSQTKQLTPLAGNARNNVQGATSESNGVSGLVPAPLIADRNKFLKGDGTWATVEGGVGNVYTGTSVEWGTMSLSEKAQYKLVNFTDDTSGFNVDSVPTENSQNVVQSGGTYSAIQSVNTALTITNNVLGAKNLLPNNAQSMSIGRITYTVNSDGSITIDGTATVDYYYPIYNLDFTLAKGRYILSGCPSGGSMNTYRFNLMIGNHGIHDLGEGVEFELDEDSVVTECHFKVVSGQTFNNAVIKPMIRPASITDDTYVPYSRTNQELAGEVEPMLNELGAKNLLPITGTSQTINGITFTFNPDGSVTVNGTASDSIYFIYYTTDSASGYPLKNGETYIVSGHPDGLSDASRIQLEMNGSTIGMSKLNNGLFTAPAFNNRLNVYIRIQSGETLNNKIFYPMIRPASIQDGTYVPYAMTNRELTEKSPTILYTSTGDAGLKSLDIDLSEWAIVLLMIRFASTKSNSPVILIPGQSFTVGTPTELNNGEVVNERYCAYGHSSTSNITIDEIGYFSSANNWQTRMTGTLAPNYGLWKVIGLIRR